MSDPVDHPAHYTSHPSGVEVITITEHMNFCLGNAVKYILRADLKGNAEQDLRKAKWYIEREIERRAFLAEVEAASTPVETDLFEYFNSGVAPHGQGLWPATWLIKGNDGTTRTEGTKLKLKVTGQPPEAPYISPYPYPPCIECGTPADGLAYCKECCE